jgi:uncharacterized C2H2 Zn-finger protein
MTARAEKQTWRCHTCGEAFTAWAPAQRHANDSHGGARIEIGEA